MNIYNVEIYIFYIGLNQEIDQEMNFNYSHIFKLVFK